LWGALSDERTGLTFIYAAGPCQRNLSLVRAPWVSRPYFTHIWDFPFRRLLRLAGSWWRYSIPPPHGEDCTLITASFYNWPVLFTDCLLPSLSLMSCIVGSYREHHIQRLHLICALWVQRVNCCVEKCFRLIAVLSLLRNDFSVAFILVA
jgi:hypothetical protein